MASFVHRATSVVLLLLASREAHAGEEPSLGEQGQRPLGEKEKETEKAVSGARLKVGAFALAHVRRESHFDKEPGTVAPGVELGVGWRFADWEIDALARGAHFQEPNFLSSRGTTMLSLGGRARWFVRPSSSVSPFLELGLDVSALRVDAAHGIGPSAHAGVGIEMLHDRAHHRLRIGLGLDVPAYAVTYAQVSLGSGWSSQRRPLYLVPATLAATWTF
jgi:hypothetical protein